MCKKNQFCIAAVCILMLALTVCGSFWDYEIANALYLGQTPRDNIFGIIFAFIGIIPTFVGWSFLGASILALSRSQVESLTRRRWLIALSVLLFLFSFFYFCNTLLMVNGDAFPVHWAVAYPIGISVIAFAALLGYKLAKRSENPKLLKTVLLLAAISLLTMVIIMSTKEIMNRPRFRLVLKIGDPELFRSWWQSGRDIKASLGDALSDEFSSFPSGHSAYSMFAIFLFPALADYVPKLEKYRFWLFICGFGWWGLTALSRLTVGAHYLSDVCIAGVVTLISFGIVELIRYTVAKRRAAAKNT